MKVEHLFIFVVLLFGGYMTFFSSFGEELGVSGSYSTQFEVISLRHETNVLGSEYYTIEALQDGRYYSFDVSSRIIQIFIVDENTTSHGEYGCSYNLLTRPLFGDSCRVDVYTTLDRMEAP